MLAMLAFSMPMFFLLNVISSQNMWVFIVVIFGCNIVYDVTKQILFSKIDCPEIWLNVNKYAYAGLALIILSFVGVYIDIFVWSGFGIGFIWFPCYFGGMWFIAKAESRFKNASKAQSNN